MNTTIQRIGKEMSIKVEQYIRLSIKPKPWWFPASSKTWEKFVARNCMVLEYHTVNQQKEG